MAVADEQIETLARTLRQLRQELGTDYWQDNRVIALQEELRYAIATYASWSADKLPLHQRSRRAARYESECAPLLWPGRSDD